MKVSALSASWKHARNYTNTRVLPVVSRCDAWITRAAASLRQKLLQIRSREPGPDCSTISACIYLALFVPVIACVVYANSKSNVLSNDTLLLISNFESLERFSSLWPSANANPLQALFDIFPSGHRLDAMPNIIGHALFGSGMHVDFFYSFCGILLTLSVGVMARSIGMRWGVAVLAGVLLPLLIAPTFGPIPLAEDMYIAWPILYYSAAGTVLVTALFWRIDGRSWWLSSLWTAIIIAVLLHLSVIQIFHMAMMAPALLAMGFGALAASTTRKELVTKIVCAAVILGALGAAGIFHYLYATGINGAQYVFFQELPNFGTTISPPQWDVTLKLLAQVFFTPFGPRVHSNAAGDVMVPLSQFGAIYLAVFGETRTARIFGRTMLVWIVATATTIVLLANFFYYAGKFYMGPDPNDFIPILWPYYVICLASLIFVVTERLVVALSSAARVSRGTLRYVPHLLLILSLAVPLTIGSSRALWEWPRPWWWSMPKDQVRPASFAPGYNRRSPLIDFLEPRIGIALGRKFQGSVFFMPTVYDEDVKPYDFWRREWTFDYTRSFLGNDLGTYGLRYYNIPTFDQTTHNIAPAFYLTVRELLSRPGIDTYERHYGGAITRLNPPIMELLGLRYLIADYELPVGAERFAMPIPDEAKTIFEGSKVLKSPLRIYELPDPNLGDYSPTNVVRAKTAKEIIVAMVHPQFNGRQTVLTDDLSIPDNLVAATGAAMTVQMGGVALSASSAGQSVLVLPVQYSHCWQIVSGSDASLFRANLMQLGVRFSGELRLELRQIFGPFWQSACRVADAADIERLRLVEAVGAAHDMNKISGDGVNLITKPLDELFGASTLLSIKSVGGNAPLREYVVTAQGPATDHYALLRVPNLTPGPYTLSMQVRAKGAQFLMLQIADGQNAAIANYLLPQRLVWPSRLGQGDNPAATIQKIDDYWLQLTLTGTLSAERAQSAYIGIQLRDNSNRGAFRPNGQAVTIRAVQLERGETATPYREFSLSQHPG